MKVQISTNGCPTMATANEVPPKMLEPGKFYTAVIYEIDDDGNASYSSDIIHVFLDTIEGKKNVRVMRFLLGNKTKRYSQVIGTRFFGPLSMGIIEANAPVLADGLDIESIMAKASQFQTVRTSAPVNSDNVFLPTAIKEEPVCPSTCPACSKPNATLSQGTDGEPAMYYCDPANGGCDEIWEAKL